MYDSFVRYQARLIRVFDRLAKPYGFEVVDAGRPGRGSLRDHPAFDLGSIQAQRFSNIWSAELFTSSKITVDVRHFTKDGV